MKIKSDFVTNSSSSSFIVAFPKRITHYDDVWFHIKGTDKAHQVLKDAERQKPYRVLPTNKSLMKRLITEISYRYYNDHLDELYASMKAIPKEEANLNWTKIYGEDYWEFEQNLSKAHAKIIAQKFIEEVKMGWIYFFNYGDESGSFFSEMEHGDTFKELKHIQISHH